MVAKRLMPWRLPCASHHPLIPLWPTWCNQLMPLRTLLQPALTFAARGISHAAMIFQLAGQWKIFPGIVLQATGAVLTIQCADGGSLSYLAPDQLGEMRFVHQRRWCRQPVQVVNVPAPSILEVRPLEEPALQERRADERVPLDQELSVRAHIWLGGLTIDPFDAALPRPVWSARVIDIGSSGLGVSPPAIAAGYFNQGDLVGLELMNKTQIILRTNARVRRKSKDGQEECLGLCFEHGAKGA